MTGPQSTWTQDCSQRGSILVAASVFLIVGLILLGSIQIGYMYYVKRDLQKAADIAALTGVQSIGTGDAAGCSSAKAAAVDSAVDPKNNSVGLVAGDVTQECLFWDTKNGGDIDASANKNALKVTLTKDASVFVPYWGDSTTVVATATAAMDQPTAVFSVGSRIAALNSHGLVASLLKTLGPSLTDPELTVLDSSGLANANIKMSSLLGALDIPVSVVTAAGTPQEVADLTQVSISKLLSVSRTILVGQKDGNVDIGALDNIIGLFAKVPTLGDKKISLLGEGGIFSTSPVDPAAALNASINVLSLIGTSAVVANGDNLLKLDVNQPPIPLLGDALIAKAQVVEPPSIGVGGIGTKASTAQIRLYVDVDTDEIPLVGGLLGGGGLFPGGVARLHLPLVVDVAPSQGTLADVCGINGQTVRKQALINVQSSLANVCVGKFGGDENAVDYPFSTTQSCADYGVTSPIPIVTIGPLKLRSKVVLPVGVSGVSPVTLTAPPGEPSFQTISPTDLVNLSSLTKAIVNVLVGSLLNSVASGADRSVIAETLVGDGESPYPKKGNKPDKIRDAIKYNLLNGVTEPVETSLANLGNSLAELPLGTLSTALGGVVSGVGGLVGNVTDLVGNLVGGLLDVLNGFVSCEGVGGLFCSDQQFRQERSDVVENKLLDENNLSSVTAGLAMAVLQPVLDPLSSLLNNLIDNIGLNLGETDVKLYSVNCGGPHLVQ